jgi:hypothetical protein
MLVFLSFAALIILHWTFDWNTKRLESFVNQSKLDDFCNGNCILRQIETFKVRSKANGPEIEKVAFVLSCNFDESVKEVPEPSGMEDGNEKTLHLASATPFHLIIGEKTYTEANMPFNVNIKQLREAKIVKANRFMTRIFKKNDT